MQNKIHKITGMKEDPQLELLDGWSNLLRKCHSLQGTRNRRGRKSKNDLGGDYSYLLSKVRKISF